MKKLIIVLIISIFFNGCKPKQHTIETFESELLKIKPVSENIFIHTSYLQTNDFGKVACNGMVYFNEDEAIFFDTPVANDASKELIHWIEKKQRKNIKALIVTHFHNDCIGGLQEFHNRGIRSYANSTTIELAKKNKEEVLPKYGFEGTMEFTIGKEPVFVRFFGQGHTADNVVGYIPGENALFGGCLVKSLGASKGYLGDANTDEWSATVEKIQKEFPDLSLVIPGHGKSGGKELLEYTRQLFAK